MQGLALVPVLLVQELVPLEQEPVLERPVLVQELELALQVSPPARKPFL